MPATAVVTIKVPADLTREQYLAGTKVIAPKFQGVPGLVRKNFIFSRESAQAGGVYTWETREAGERFHAKGGAWHTSLVERFGVAPTVQWFDTDLIVDNSVGRIDVAS
ncbi:MAG: monooxygenase [Betaproteobacteria bacterium]|nr:monooxygenase [Betaproteobacteria bacterium]